MVYPKTPSAGSAECHQHCIYQKASGDKVYLQDHIKIFHRENRRGEEDFADGNASPLFCSLVKPTPLNHCEIFYCCFWGLFEVIRVGLGAFDVQALMPGMQT